MQDNFLWNLWLLRSNIALFDFFIFLSDDIFQISRKNGWWCLVNRVNIWPPDIQTTLVPVFLQQCNNSWNCTNVWPRDERVAQECDKHRTRIIFHLFRVLNFFFKICSSEINEVLTLKKSNFITFHLSIVFSKNAGNVFLWMLPV